MEEETPLMTPCEPSVETRFARFKEENKRAREQESPPLTLLSVLQKAVKNKMEEDMRSLTSHEEDLEMQHQETEKQTDILLELSKMDTLVKEASADVVEMNKMVKEVSADVAQMKKKWAEEKRLQATKPPSKPPVKFSGPERALILGVACLFYFYPSPTICILGMYCIMTGFQ